MKLDMSGMSIMAVDPPHPNIIFLTFPTFSNNNMEDARTCEMGSRAYEFWVG
jgi:hypothetical protein